MNWLEGVVDRLRSRVVEASQVEVPTQALVDRVEMTVWARCPCGSKTLHPLTLHSTEDCPRCSRTIGIRKVEYFRRGASVLPAMQVSVGYVVTPDTLRLKDALPGIH